MIGIRIYLKDRALAKQVWSPNLISSCENNKTAVAATTK
jgi:hypothetical protein